MLLPEDEKYFKAKGYQYEAHRNGAITHLIIRNYRLPEGFSPQITDLLIDLPAGYPDSGPDMFWVLPHVVVERTGSEPAAANHKEMKYGPDPWQRFSRHGYPWRPGEDGIAQYLIWIRVNLENDVK